MATHDVLLLVSDAREPYRPLFSYSFAVALYENDRKRIYPRATNTHIDRRGTEESAVATFVRHHSR